MSDAPTLDTSPDLCRSSDPGQQQQLSRPPVTPQIDDTNGSRDSHGQLLFERHAVPFPATHKDDPLRNGLPSDPVLTTSAVSMMPQISSYPWVADGRLHVIAPSEILLSPSNIQYPTFSPLNPKDLSHIHSPMSLHSPTDMGSSDEGYFLRAFDDNDEEDAPQSMEHVVKWKAIRDQAIIATGTAVYIPQSIYQPYTEADRVRYIEKADLKEPIIFKSAHPDQWGVALEDAIRANMKDLLDKYDNMLENCGPSVSIRLQWPGYRAWTKQIPTMDFKSPKGPITRAKLAKNIANCVKRFIEEKEKEKERMEMEADRRWRVGTRHIRMEDLILVSLHNISKGSWQPQLRLRTPLSEIQLRRLQAQAPLSIAC